MPKPNRTSPGYNVRERNPNWRGGRKISWNGYVLVYVSRDHPMITKAGSVPEHRLVMSEYLGRPLVRGETVHHINGDRQDNRIENLELHQGNHGPGQVRICGDCGSINILSVSRHA
jgi:hypothetical protein